MPSSYLDLTSRLTDTPVSVETLVRYEPVLRFIFDGGHPLDSIMEVLPRDAGLSSLLDEPTIQIVQHGQGGPDDRPTLAYGEFATGPAMANLVVSLDGPMQFPQNKRKAFFETLVSHANKFVAVSYPLESHALDLDSFALLIPQMADEPSMHHFAMGYSLDEVGLGSARKVGEWSEPAIVHLLASYNSLTITSPILKAKVLDWIRQSRVLDDTDRPLYRKTLIYEVTL